MYQCTRNFKQCKVGTYKRRHILKAEERDEFEFPEPGLPASPGKRRGDGGKSGGRGKTPATSKKGASAGATVERTAALEAQAARWTGGPTIIEDSALFRTYRSSGGGVGGGLDTDTDTGELCACL